MTEFQTWVTTLGKTTVYKTWASKQPNDAIKWTNYTNNIINGKNPTPPTMSSGFGKALVQIVVLAMKNPAAAVGFGVSDFGVGYFGE